jgi:Fe-S-cluster containining protein
VAALPHSGAEIRCLPGCTACCYQLVVVSPLEAHALAAYLAAHPELHASITKRVASWQETVAEEPDLQAALARLNAAEGYLPAEEGAALELEYFRVGLPCPFLDPETELCTVYPVRPFVCREHLVVSPPELCTLDLDAVTTADTRLEARAVANVIGTECFGLPDRLLPLPEALEYAASHPDEPLREAPAGTVRATTETALYRAQVALARLRGIIQQSPRT